MEEISEKSCLEQHQEKSHEKVAELNADLKSLVNKWEQVRDTLNGLKTTSKLVSELDRTSVVLRDMLNESFTFCAEQKNAAVPYAL